MIYNGLMSKNAEYHKLVKTIKKDGWVLTRQSGGHEQYKHISKPGVVTIPRRNIKKNIELSVLRQAGLR